MLEDYERDFERFGKNPLPSLYESRVTIRDLSHQMAQLSSLEFDEGKRDELLGLPQTIQSMKEEVKGESKGVKEEMDRKVEEMEESHKQMIQDLTEENTRIKEEFREMRDLMNQDFKEKFDDMKVENEEIRRDNKDLRNQLKSLSTLTNNNNNNEERSEEDVRREIDQIISKIDLNSLTRDQGKRFCKLQDVLEDEEEELSNEELLEMLDELNQMKLSI